MAQIKVGVFVKRFKTRCSSECCDYTYYSWRWIPYYGSPILGRKGSAYLRHKYGMMIDDEIREFIMKSNNYPINEHFDYLLSEELSMKILSDYYHIMLLPKNFPLWKSAIFGLDKKLTKDQRDRAICAVHAS